MEFWFVRVEPNNTAPFWKLEPNFTYCDIKTDGCRSRFGFHSISYYRWSSFPRTRRLLLQGKFYQSSHPEDGGNNSSEPMVSVGGLDRQLGTATPYGLADPGFEPQWKRYFSDPSRPVPITIQPPIQCVQRLVPGGKAAGALRWSPTPS